jgi:hypothetical protein
MTVSGVSGKLQPDKYKAGGSGVLCGSACVMQDRQNGICSEVKVSCLQLAGSSIRCPAAASCPRCSPVPGPSARISSGRFSAERGAPRRAGCGARQVASGQVLPQNTSLKLYSHPACAGTMCPTPPGPWVCRNAATWRVPTYLPADLAGQRLTV